MKLKLLIQLALSLEATFIVASTQAQTVTQVGINFQTYNGSATSSGLVVTSNAFGIDPTNWYNFPQVTESNPTSGTQAITFPGLPPGSGLVLSYTAQNGWISGIGGSGAAVPPGDEQVTYGYLDDDGQAWTVALSGFRSFASSYTIQTVSASDAADGFANINIFTNAVLEEALNYTESSTQFVQVNAAGWGVSTISTNLENDAITLNGAGRVGNVRSTLAGIIITYTSPAANPPLIQVNPTVPTNTIFINQSFTLSTVASGSPTLSYQWFFDSGAVSSATNASLTVSNVTTGSSGSYFVIVSNSFGSATSSIVAIAVSGAIQPQITVNPVSEVLYSGYPASLSVQAVGGLLTYQWSLGGTAIPGATNSTLAVADVTSNSVYTITVSNPVGHVSSSATLNVIVPTGYAAVVASLQPYVYYRFSESGTLPFDGVTNSGTLGVTGNGSYAGTVTHPVAGALAGSSDTAVTFDGTTGQAIVPYASALNTPVFTAEAWLNPSVTLAGTTLTCPVSCGDFGNPRAGWLIYQNSTNWELRFYNQNGTTASLDLAPAGAIVAGTWYHVAATFDGTTATLYINGVAAMSGAASGYVSGTAGPFSVGARADSTFFWAGTADEVAYYPTALSAAQILSHYQNGTNTAPSAAYNTLVTSAGATEYLRLDEPHFYGNSLNLGTSGVFWNATESATGSLDGQPGPQAPGYPGFEATNPAVALAHGTVKTSPLNLMLSNVTFLAWVYLNGDNTAYFPGLVFQRPAATGLCLNAGDGLAYNWNNLGGDYGFVSGLTIPIDEWVLTALVVTPTNATLYLGTTNYGIQTAVNTLAHTAHDFTASGLVMGQDNGNYFNGSIDEAAVFPYALSTSQITKLYAVGTGVPLVLEVAPGGVIVDSKPVGPANDGFLRGGGTWMPSSGPDGNGITRTGVEQFVALENSQIVVPANPLFTNATGTISFWMNYSIPLAGFPGLGGTLAVLEDQRTTGPSAGALIGISTTGGIEFTTSPASRNTFTQGYVVDGLWHHIAITYNQAAGASVMLYIDGALIYTSPNAAAWTWPVGDEIELGRSHTTTYYRYDGQMDDFRIYSRVLTASEVATIAAAATSDSLIDTSTLQLRFNFDNSGIGQTLSWEYGTLVMSPVLGPGAVWTINTNVPPYAFLPTNGMAQFFQLKY